MTSMRNMTGHFNTRETPQSKPIPGRESDMKENSAGGFSFTVDCWTRLQRFLILGSEGGSYYASEQKLTEQNAKCVLECLKKDGKRTVDAIVDVSDNGRAVKNTPALYALAMACKLGDQETVAYAYKALPKVARIGTHLFQWAEAVKAFGGFSTGFQRAVQRWYTERSPHSLALQAVKYQSREGWTHRDLLRLAKPRKQADESDVNRIFGWITDRWAPGNDAVGDATDLIWAFEQAKGIGLESPNKARTGQIVKLITDYRLPREAIPTQYLNEVRVWDALLDNGGQGMPMTAMIRNLPKMTSIGLLAPMSDATKRVMDALGNAEAIKKARVHPLSVLVAMRTYASGHGVRGSLSWSPVSQVVDSLDGAFYLSFDAVEPTGKRHLLALDISSSMGCGIAGMPGIDCRTAAAAMAMVTARTEAQHHIVAFASGQASYGGSPARNHWQARNWDYQHRWTPSDGLTPVNLSPRQRLDDVCRTIGQYPAGGTDCSLPMVYAMEKQIPVDVFVVYTDSETWAGKIQPVQALRKYRDAMGIPAKLIVVGMVANEFSIADPSDAGMLDIVGMDTSAPTVMSEFTKGNL